MGSDDHHRSSGGSSRRRGNHSVSSQSGGGGSSSHSSGHNNDNKVRNPPRRHRSTRKDPSSSSSSSKENNNLKLNKTDHDVNFMNTDDFDNNEAADWFSFNDNNGVGLGGTSSSNHSFDFDSASNSFHPESNSTTSKLDGDDNDDDDDAASFHEDDDDNEEVSQDNENKRGLLRRQSSSSRRGGGGKERRRKMSSGSSEFDEEDFANNGSSHNDPLSVSERSNGSSRRGPPPRTRSGPRSRGLPSRTKSLSGTGLRGTKQQLLRENSFSRRNGGGIGGSGGHANPPSRSRSDVGLTRGASRRRLSTVQQADQEVNQEETKKLDRYNSMRALYRTGGPGGGDGESNNAETSLFDSSVRSVNNAASIGGNGGGGGPAGTRIRPRRRASLIDGAPNMLMPHEQQLSSRSGHGDSVDGGGDEGGEHSNPNPEKWLSKRADKQDDIMALTQEMRDRFTEERLQQERLQHVEDGCNEYGYGDGDFEDDQPMAMRQKKTIGEQLLSAVKKTGGVTKSAAKGSVNVVRDPKRAANRLGHLSKDVAKGTMNVVLDPTKAAKKTGKLAKNVTVGSAKVGIGITKGVTKGTLGASKAVAKGSLKATTSTVKMSGKAVKKTARAVTGSHKHKKKSGSEARYDASQLEDRKDRSFLDRINNMVHDDVDGQDEDGVAGHHGHGHMPGAGGGGGGGGGGDVEAQAAAAAAVAANHKPKPGGSILVPISAVGLDSHSRGSWDV